MDFFEKRTKKGLKTGSMHYRVARATFQRIEMDASFVLTHFDKDGDISVGEDGVLQFWIGNDDVEVLHDLMKNIPYPFSLRETISYANFNYVRPKGVYYIIALGSNAVETCNWMYMNSFNDDIGRMFEMMNRVFGSIKTFNYMKERPDAIAPTKAHVTDSGFDLWLVNKISENNGVMMYDTGIAVQPPHGFYFDLVGRSSISGTGHMLANNIGIIDQGYQGTIKVALVKTSPDVPDLQLPSKIVQLIPRLWHHMIPVETAQFGATSLRGAGGFGSTDKSTLENLESAISDLRASIDDLS